MRLYSSSSASVSELVSVTSMRAMCPTSACTFGIDVAGEEVVADAVAQAARLAHVQQFGLPVLVGAEYMRYTPGRRGRFGMKSLGSNRCGVLAHAVNHKPASVAALFSTVWNISAVRRRVCVL